jgi:hypothetical protein
MFEDEEVEDEDEPDEESYEDAGVPVAGLPVPCGASIGAASTDLRSYLGLCTCAAHLGAAGVAPTGFKLHSPHTATRGSTEEETRTSSTRSLLLLASWAQVVPPATALGLLAKELRLFAAKGLCGGWAQPFAGIGRESSACIRAGIPQLGSTSCVVLRCRLDVCRLTFSILFPQLNSTTASPPYLHSRTITTTPTQLHTYIC